MKKISVILIGIVVVTIGILSIQKEEKKVLIEEELNNNNTSLAFYIEQENGVYQESSSLPSTGYVLDTEKSICTNNTTPVWEDDKLYLDNLQNRGTSCYLYFQRLCPIGAEACEAIVANNPNISNERSNGITGPLTEDTTGTLFTAEDDYGTSLIFAGNIDNNWIKFGGFYWRIIRINGNGSVRMIYSGEDTGSVTEANRTGATTQIGTSAFNEEYNDNAYVGYMYGTPGSSTYEETHANINDSTIKTVLDNWYQQNLLSYSEYISTEAGFCNDRSLNTTSETWWSDDTKLGYGTNETAYGPYGRLILNANFRSNQTPSLKCSQTNDLFTVSGNSKGNYELTYPIGLITSDEVVLAGGFGGYDNNTGYWLYTNQDYWTMSSTDFHTNGHAGEFVVYLGGDLSGGYVYGTHGVRPVINLDAYVSISGSGTTTDPYKVEGA